MSSQHQRNVNYIYFGILFFFLAFLHIYQIFLIDDDSFFHRAFYVIYALGQCFVEVGALSLLGNFFVRKFPKSLNPIFIVLTFILFLIHIIDFPLVRIMDMSIWYVLDFVSAESFDNFIEMLYASNIPLKTWIVGGVVVLLLPVVGIIFFRLTDLIVRKKPLNISYATAGISLLAIALFLSLFDFRTGKMATPSDDSRFLKALPWKTTLFTSAYPVLTLGKTLKELPDEASVLAQVETLSLSSQKRPNIFLFVIESLRDDFLTAEVAPAIAKFREDNLSFPLALSAANNTHHSWFSLFHSRYALRWGKMQPHQWGSGSLPLQVLKKAGYKTHVYSSARFGYYQMDEILFGRTKNLADSLHVFASDGTSEIYESDAACFGKLQQDMETYKNDEGHVFMVFLDATHFDYSWPKREPLQFTPIVDQIDYLKVAYSKENIEGIKNRYRNAIFYIDSLFALFQQKLHTVPMGKEAVVVLTGDHGEEFFEEGNIFHASNLSTMQTQVPIYYRFGQQKVAQSSEWTSHLDIFPSILDYVFGHVPLAHLWDGESLFRPKTRNFTVTTRYNASRAPYEFFIHNGKEKTVFRFLNQRNIYQSQALQVLSKRDRNDELLPVDVTDLSVEWGAAFEYLFKK